MSQPRSVAQNTTWFILAFVIQKVFSFLYFTYIARVIGVTDIGRYHFALSFATIFTIFTDLGLSGVLVREIAKFKDKTKEYLNNILSLKLGLALLSYLVLFLVIKLSNKSEVVSSAVYLAGLAMLLDSFCLIFFGVFRGYRDLKYESIGLVCFQFVIIAFGLLFLFSGGGVKALVIAFLLGNIFKFLFCIILLKVKLKIIPYPLFNKKTVIFLFRIAFPFALAGIFAKIYTSLDSVLLSYLISDEAVGWYSIPNKILLSIQFIPAAFIAAVFPAMSHYFVNNENLLKKTFEKSFAYLIIIAMPCAFGITSLAPEIILKIWGNEFANSIIALEILMAALVFVFLGYPLGSLLNACNRQVKNAVYMGVTMVSNVILNLVLIPRYSYVGAGVAVIISSFIYLVLGLYETRKVVSFEKRFLAMIFLKSLIAASLMSGVVWYLKQNIYFALTIPIGAVIYLSVLWGLGGIGREDLKLVLGAISSKRKVKS